MCNISNFDWSINHQYLAAIMFHFANKLISHIWCQQLCSFKQDMFDKEIFSESLCTSAFVFSSSTASVHLLHHTSIPWSFLNLPWFLKLICGYIKDMKWSFIHWMLCYWTLKLNIYVQGTRFNLVNETARKCSHKTFW